MVDITKVVTKNNDTKVVDITKVINKNNKTKVVNKTKVHPIKI